MNEKEQSFDESCAVCGSDEADHCVSDDCTGCDGLPHAYVPPRVPPTATPEFEAWWEGYVRTFDDARWRDRLYSTGPRERDAAAGAWNARDEQARQREAELIVQLKAIEVAVYEGHVPMLRWTADLPGMIRAQRCLLDGEIEALKHPGFVAFVALLDDFLTHYPPNTAVCSDKPNADVGAKFTHALRTARLLLPNQIKE